jgi:hypothetical protein
MRSIFTLGLLALAASVAFAQGPKNEIKWNIGNTIALGSVEVGYEYFLDDHQSVGAEVFINDVYNFSVGRQVKDFNTNSFAVSYNYYTGTNDKDFVISPFIKVRTGDYQKTSNDPVIDMDSFILGIGGGYKWNLNDKFVFGPYFTVARNFSGEINDEFDTPLEFTLGFGVGYRF